MDPDARRRVAITEGSSPAAANSRRPSKSNLLYILLLFVASVYVLISFRAGEKWWMNALTCEKIPPRGVHFIVKAMEALLILLCIGVMIALCRGIYLRSKFAASPSNRQLERSSRYQTFK